MSTKRGQMDLSAQEEQEGKIEKRRDSLKGSKSRLERTLKTKSKTNSCEDPIEAICRNNPGLSREKVVRMAEAFGF